MMRVEATGKIYKQAQSLTYLEGPLTKTLDISVVIARRTYDWWMHIRRCLREIYDQPKVALSIKLRMTKDKVIEALLLYGFSTWTLSQEHYANPRTVHHRVLFPIIGAQRRDQTIG